MNKLISELSVFFPTYNEEEAIIAIIAKAKKTLETIASKWEIIIVEDGSKDRTPEITDEIVEKNKRSLSRNGVIKVIHHKPNRGYGGALQTGIYNSQYKWIAFTDSDGQFDFSEIANFIEKQKETGADAVIGYYKKRQVSKFKIITSKAWELAVFLLFGLHVKDIDCGFKLISKKIVGKIPKLESERGAFISSEFLIKTKKEGFKIVEVPVTHYPRKTGSGTGRHIKVIIKSFLDLGKLWIKLNLS